MSLALPLIASLCLTAPQPTPVAGVGENGCATSNPGLTLGAIDEFLQRHDKLLCSGNFKELSRCYAEDFIWPDMGIIGRDEMLHQWQGIWANYKKVKLKTEALRVQRQGSSVAVSACRPFAAITLEAGEQVRDDFCHTILLREVRPDEFVITQLYDMDHSRLAHMGKTGHYGNPDLLFSVQAPDGWFTIPHRKPGTTLEKLIFLNADQTARIDLSILQPSQPLNLKAALIADLNRDDRCRWNQNPREFPLERMTALAAEAQFCMDNFGEELQEDLTLSAVYATPDQTSLFAMVLKSPSGVVQTHQEDLEQLAHSLRLTAAKATDYSTLLMQKHPEWNTVENRIYEHSTAPLSMEIPIGLTAIPLASSEMQRVRLEFDHDPGSFILLQVYEPMWLDDAPKKLMERSAERLFGTVCQPDDDKLGVTELSLRFLDSPATQCVIEVQCSVTGRILTHRLVSTSRDHFYIQLALVAQSDRAELQSEMLERVCAALIWDD